MFRSFKKLSISFQQKSFVFAAQYIRQVSHLINISTNSSQGVTHLAQKTRYQCCEHKKLFITTYYYQQHIKLQEREKSFTQTCLILFRSNATYKLKHIKKHAEFNLRSFKQLNTSQASNSCLLLFRIFLYCVLERVNASLYSSHNSNPVKLNVLHRTFGITG